MPMRSFEAYVRHQPPFAIMDLHGEMNALAEDALIAAYARVESQASSIILLNFQHVEYINSTGIALLLSLFARARGSHRLLVCGLNEHYVEIFRILRLNNLMDVFSDETSALASVYQSIS